MHLTPKIFIRLQCDYYNRGHLDKENQTILQNGNEEFQLQLFELISFQFNTTFQHGIKLNFSIPLYNNEYMISFHCLGGPGYSSCTVNEFTYNN